MSDPLRDFLDPSRDRKERMIRFFIWGDQSVLSVSRPALYGLNQSSGELIGWFMEMLDRVDEIKGLIVDRLERQAIRRRILE